MSNNFESTPPIYDTDGKVNDPDVARVGAEIEGKYRKKLFGVLERSEQHVTEGKLKAELAMEKAETISLENVPAYVTAEFENYVRAIENKHGNEETLHAIPEATISNLGEGTTRYRLWGEVIDRYNRREHFRIMIDVNNKNIINSECFGEGPFFYGKFDDWEGLP